MKVAVVGDALCDIEVYNGHFNGNCPENREVSLFKGCSMGVFAGGAGNTANVLTGLKATTDLYCQGPGGREHAWVSALFKQAMRANRIVWSNDGSIPMKVRGCKDNKVMLRIDCETYTPNKNGFPALEMLADEADRYDAIVFSDYCKGLISENTEQVIRRIIKNARLTCVNSKRHDYSLWRGVTAITTNMHEAASIFSTTCPVEIAQLSGVGLVYITDGPNDVKFCSEKTFQSVRVSDDIENPYIVGAGDSFIAGLAVALANNMSPHEAGQNGVKVAQNYIGRMRKSFIR